MFVPRQIWLPIVLWVFLSLLSGCDLPRNNPPSILVIAVEGLSFESLSCDADETNAGTLEGIRAFCEEAVRFSHAYAPSTMSQASMASLMTGLYPFDHGVHQNGSDFLSARFRTLAEGALGKGYHSLFISGGAPIWRKSGLAQGFEVFDDTMDLGLGNYYRSAGEVVRLAMNWVDHESSSAPFLSVLFLNDLQFPQITTHNKAGEVREKSSLAQTEAIAESIGILVQYLKTKRRWNSTHVVLAGLGSLDHHPNDDEPTAVSLKSSGVQVSLFIKPARKEQDNVIQWAVDKNVSLVDVGKTMFQWLGLEPPACSIPELEPVSLVEAVSQAAPTWKDDRMILSESAWPEWMDGTGTRTAIRQERFLFINDQRPLIFNTLTDRMETLPLKVNDPLWISLNAQVMGLLKKMGSPTWNGMKSQTLETLEVARELWHNQAAGRHPLGKEPWSKWYLRQALTNRDWHEVKRLAQENGDPVGTFVAGRNLGEALPAPHDSCVRLVLGTKGEHGSYQAECANEGILALHAWQTARGEEERTYAQERFLKLYAIQLMDQQIGRLNYLSECRWDVDRELPEAPQPLDYLLTLKELEPFAKKASGLLSDKDATF